MHVEFEQEWRAARSLEIEGKLEEAKRIYEVLIGQDPHRLYVRLRLSALEQAAGRYLASRAHALLAAETVERGRWGDLGVVTRRLLTFDERARTRELINKADWTSRDVLKDAAVLAQHLWLIGQVEESFNLIERCRAFIPMTPNLSYARANVLKYLGRMEEATDEYERALKLEPTSPYVHWSLAYHVPSPRPSQRIPRILHSRQQFPEQAPEQPYFHYALYKEYENAGDFDAAWSHLAAGAEIKRRQVRYDAVIEEAGFQALERAFSAPLPERTSASRQDAHVPIFIVGMPRSGTTLLERILGNCPDVAAGGELNDFNSALARQADAFIGSAATPQLVEQLRKVDLDEVGADYLRRTTDSAKGARFLVDKNPTNFIYAGYIAKALPQAKILCLRRDPMDACFSNLKELFSDSSYGYSYDLPELVGHCVRFERLADHWQRMAPQFLQVSYESLVMSPAETARRVLEFCGLPFEAGVTDITRNPTPVATASSSQVRAPINSKGIGAWRKYERHLAPLREMLDLATTG